MLDTRARDRQKAVSPVVMERTGAFDAGLGDIPCPCSAWPTSGDIPFPYAVHEPRNVPSLSVSVDEANALERSECDWTQASGTFPALVVRGQQRGHSLPLCSA
jgi:hypothetical protein